MYIESKQALAEELELKRPAVLAVSGAHNSGKTTLLEKLPVSYTHLTLPTIA